MAYHLTSLKSIRIPAIALAALLTSGCAVDKAGCDPSATRTAGFLTKLSCDFSGSYEARAEDKRQEAANLEAQRASMQQEINRLKSQSQQLSEKVLRSRVQRDRAISSLNQSLNALKVSAANDAKVRQQIEDTQKQLAELNMTADDLNTKQLQAKVQALKNEIDDLTGQMVMN
jgi:chromosome segregation ATPase